MTKIVLILFIINLFFNIGCSSNSQNIVEEEITNSQNIFNNDIPIVSSFDCKNFNYEVDSNYFVDKKGRPYLTAEDVDKMLEYGIRSQQIKSLINKNDTLKRGLLYLLPRIRNIIDTAFYDLLILNEKDYSYKSLEKSQVYDLISSDAVIMGEVIDKKLIIDISKCFLYKTEYLVKVNEVLHSYFRLKIEDKVLLKSTMGLEGGCNTSNPKLRGITNHGNEYQIGDKWIFFLKHGEYYNSLAYYTEQSHLLFNDEFIKKFDDEYCEHAFHLYNGNHLYDYNDEKLINEIRSFFETLPN